MPQSSDGGHSEVARLLNEIREEYEAATRGLSGMAEGTCRHSFITTRMENMQKLHLQLQRHVGDVAIALIAERLDAPNKQV
jgi:hypothetical protein